ncbi:MAG: ABC transporter permease [Bacteroidetes bacterium]|jgi:ABC-type lipoprotein release transport system permease subunit|nr:ABC transporter permease [Bacteroidota bacterium]
MLLSISWRNIWRNKVRSLVIIFSIALGIFAGVISGAFFKGMADQRIQKVIKTELSYIQVHNPGFEQTSDFANFISNAEEIDDSILKIPNVVGVSRRMSIESMAASAETASGVLISGIFPEDEKTVTSISSKLIDGKYFEGIARNPVVIGKKLAEKLNVKVRSKIILTIQDLENNITSGAFRVAGIYSTDNNMFDEANIFVRFSDLQKLTNFPIDGAHEIAINIDDNNNLASVLTAVKDVTGNKLDVKSWKELSPEMNYLTEAMDMYMYIFIIIILMALLFGIINTMLMVVMERTKEIGMLMAIGMNKIKVFSMIVFESVMLSLTGGIVGIIIGAISAKFGETHPIDLSIWAQGYQQLGYDAFVYTSLDPEMLINVTVLVILTGIIAAIYPAYKALKNDPADALRIE